MQPGVGLQGGTEVLCCNLCAGGEGGGEGGALRVDAPTAGICLSSFGPPVHINKRVRANAQPPQSRNEAVRWGQRHSSEAELTTVISLALLANWSGGKAPGPLSILTECSAPRRVSCAPTQDRGGDGSEIA